MKKGLYLILILLATGLFYVRFRYGSQPSVTAPSPSPALVSPSPSLSSEPSLSAVLDNAYFTLNYAPVATTSTRTAPDSTEWVISYMGETQKQSGRTQTELFDGYAVSVTRFLVIGDDPAKLQAEADRQGTIDACGEENVTPLKAGKLGSYDTLTFFGGCLGEADQHYLMQADTLYRVTIMIVGTESDKARYQTTVTAMLNSLRFK